MNAANQKQENNYLNGLDARDSLDDFFKDYVDREGLDNRIAIKQRSEWWRLKYYYNQGY